MKKYLKYGSLCCGLLWLAACSSDCPGEGYTDSIPELPGGQFVVDYSVGETASRAFGEHLQANQRISSLTYLLYDGDALVKKREIPAINTKTVWPLKRETMTWEQREALKDTLTAGVTYTAVFVANEDKTRFETDFAEADTTYLTGEDKLSTVALQLPTVPFQDKSMFYLAKETIGAKDTEKLDRHNPLNKPVTLQRIVSRTDIRRKAALEDADILAGMEKGKMNEAVITAVDKALDGFCEALKKKDITNLELASYSGKLVNFIKSEKVHAEAWKLASAEMIKACKSNELYKSQVANWNSFAEATFAFPRLSNQFLVSTLAATGDVESSIQLTVDKDGSLSFCSFSNATEKDEKLNVLTSLSLKNAAGDELVLGTALPIRGGKNIKKEYECNPIDTISTALMKSAPSTVALNLDVLVGTIDEVLNRKDFVNITIAKETFKRYINEVLSSYESSTWNAFKLPVTIPDVSGNGIRFKAAYAELKPTPAPVP